MDLPPAQPRRSWLINRYIGQDFLKLYFNSPESQLVYKFDLMLSQNVNHKFYIWYLIIVKIIPVCLSLMRIHYSTLKPRSSHGSEELGSPFTLGQIWMQCRTRRNNLSYWNSLWDFNCRPYVSRRLLSTLAKVPSLGVSRLTKLPDSIRKSLSSLFSTVIRISGKRWCIR